MHIPLRSSQGWPGVASLSETTHVQEGHSVGGRGLPCHGMRGHCKGKGGSAGTFLGISSCHDLVPHWLVVILISAS